VSRGKVRVRQAVELDVAELVALTETVDLGRGLFSGRPLPVESRPQLAKRFAEIVLAGQPVVLVAVDEATDEVVGFAAIREDELTTITRTPVLHITHLIVTPKSRKRGIGRTLLAAVVHLADDRGVDHVLATVGTGSRDANRYLSRLGFAPLVLRRLAPTSVLRRSLGMAEAPDRLAMRRRLRAGRSARPTRLTAASRSIRRGA
jgi:ribosomal protein S18 acetylase RimI-like enzyme